MTPAEMQAVQAENRFLKQRVLDLQDDVTDLSAQVVRLTASAEERFVRRSRTPDPLSGGQ